MADQSLLTRIHTVLTQVGKRQAVGVKTSDRLVQLAFFIDLLQLFSFTVLVKQPGAWGISFLGGVFSTAPYNAAFEDGNPAPVVVALVYLSVFSGLIGYSFLLSWRNVKAPPSWLHEVLNPMSGFTVSIGYIPVFSSLFGFGDSLIKDDVWGGNSGTYLGGVALILVSLLFFLATLIIVATCYERKPASDIPLARPHSRIDVLHHVIRTVLCISGFVFHDIDVAMVSIVTVSAFALAYAYTMYLPYYRFDLSRLRAIFMWVFALAAIAHIFAYFEDDVDEDWGSAAVLFTGLPLAVLGAYLFTERHRESLINKPIEDIDSPLLIELKVRFYLQDCVQERSMDSKAELLLAGADGADQQDFHSLARSDEQARATIDQWWLAASRRFGNSAMFFVQWGFHVLEFQGNYQKALVQLDEALERNPWFDESFLIDLLKNEMQEIIESNCESFLRYLKYQRYMAEARYHDVHATKARLKFLAYLSKTAPDLETIYDLGVDLECVVQDAKSYYEKAIQIHSSTPQDLRAYGSFLVDIYQLPDDGMMVLRRAEEIENARQRRRKLQDMSKAQAMNTDVFDDRNAVIGTDAQGQIITVNPGGCQMLGYASSELVGQDIAVITPPPFNQMHQMFMESHRTSGVDKLQGQKRMVFALHKTGHIMPVVIMMRRVAVESEENNEVVFLGVMTKIQSDDLYMLVDENKGITAWSSQCINTFPVLGSGSGIEGGIDVDICLPGYQDSRDEFKKKEGELINLSAGAEAGRMHDSDSDDGDNDDEDKEEDEEEEEEKAVDLASQCRVWVTEMNMKSAIEGVYEFKVDIVRMRLGLDALNPEDVAESRNRTEKKAHDSSRQHLASSTNQKKIRMDGADRSEAGSGMSGSEIRSIGKSLKGFSAFGKGSSMTGGTSTKAAAAMEKVDSAWFRKMFRTYQDHHGTGLKRLLLVAGVTCFLILTAAISSYVIIEEFEKGMSETLDHVFVGQDMRYDYVGLMYNTRSLVYVQRGDAQEYYDGKPYEQVVRQQLRDISQQLQDSHLEILPSILKDPEHKRILTMDQIPAKLNRAGTVVTRYQSLQQALWRVINSARLLAEEELEHIDDDNEYIFFMLKNDVVSFAPKLNESCWKLATTQADSTDAIEITEIAFACGTVALTAIVLIFVWRPAINMTQKNKKDILNLFLDVPRGDVHRMLKDIRKRGKSEEATAGGDAGDEDVKKDEEDGATSAKNDGYGDMDNADSSESKRSNRTTFYIQLRVFVLLVLVAGYFIGILFWSLATLDHGVELSYNIVYAGQRLVATRRVAGFTREVAGELNGTKRNEHKAYLTTQIDWARATHDALLYGNPGLVRQKGSMTNQKELYFEDNCLSHEVMRTAGCETYYDGLNMFGLDAVLTEFLHVSSRVMSVINETTPVNITTPDMMFIEDMSRKWLREGLLESMFDYRQEATAGLKEHIKVRLILMIIFSIAVVLIMKLLHLPLIYRLGKEDELTHTITLAIPLTVMKRTPTFNEWVEQHINIFHNIQN